MSSGAFNVVLVVVLSLSLDTECECNNNLSLSHTSQNQEFAIDVTLSDESSYVIFRTVKEITTFHVCCIICPAALQVFVFGFQESCKGADEKVPNF